MKLTRGQLIASFLCLIPAGSALWAFFTHTLSANPIQDLTLRSGQTALRLLLASLSCTSLNTLLGLRACLPIRKTLGLFSFLYAALHFLIFAGLDFEFRFAWIAGEIMHKPFLQIGLVALLLLLLLSITSTQKIQKKFGSAWQSLHRFVYLAAVLIIVHIFLAAKGDYQLPFIYAAFFIGLMILRLPPLNRFTIRDKPPWLLELNKFLLKAVL